GLSGHLEYDRPLFLCAGDGALDEPRRDRRAGGPHLRAPEVHPPLPGDDAPAPHPRRDGALGARDLLACGGERARDTPGRGRPRRLLGFSGLLALFSGALRLALGGGPENGRQGLRKPRFQGLSRLDRATSPCILRANSARAAGNGGRRAFFVTWWIYRCS